jgi:hypothetical protein
MMRFLILTLAQKKNPRLLGYACQLSKGSIARERTL